MSAGEKPLVAKKLSSPARRFRNRLLAGIPEELVPNALGKVEEHSYIEDEIGQPWSVAITLENGMELVINIHVTNDPWKEE